MNYAAAMKALRDGSTVKRADWDNYLRLGKVGNPEFVIAVQSFGDKKDRTYSPTAIDQTATDWQSK